MGPCYFFDILLVDNTSKNIPFVLAILNKKVSEFFRGFYLGQFDDKDVILERIAGDGSAKKASELGKEIPTAL